MQDTHECGSAGKGAGQSRSDANRQHVILTQKLLFHHQPAVSRAAE